MSREQWGIVGLGRAGRSLAKAMIGAGINVVVGVVSQESSCQKRSRELPFPVTTDMTRVADVDIVLIAVPDLHTALVAEEIAAGGANMRVALHISAVHPAEVLRSLADCGVAVGSCHPLLTLTGDQVSFADSYFAVEGDSEAVECAQTLASVLKATAVDLAPGSKALYHAGAVVACNYVVTLVACALRLFKQAGISADLGYQMLLPLLRQTVDNVQALGVYDALTGPVVRGDVDTVQLHGKAIEQAGLVEIEQMYRVLGVLTAEVARDGDRLSKADFSRLVDALRDK